MPGTVEKLHEYISKTYTLAGFVFILSYPFLTQHLSGNALVIIFLVLILVMFVNLEGRTTGSLIGLNLLVSSFGLIYFEFSSLSVFFSGNRVVDLFFVSSNLLALIFLFSLYLSTHLLMQKLVN